MRSLDDSHGMEGNSVLECSDCSTDVYGDLPIAELKLMLQCDIISIFMLQCSGMA